MPLKEDAKIGWHHQFNGCEFEQTLGDCEGQGRLVSCSLLGHKEWDMSDNNKGTKNAEKRTVISKRSNNSKGNKSAVKIPSCIAIVKTSLEHSLELFFRFKFLLRPFGSDGKQSPCNAGNLGYILG